MCIVEEEDKSGAVDGSSLEVSGFRGDIAIGIEGGGPKSLTILIKRSSLSFKTAAFIASMLSSGFFDSISSAD